MVSSIALVRILLLSSALKTGVVSVSNCVGYEPLITHVEDSQLTASSVHNYFKYQPRSSKLTVNNALQSVYGWQSSVPDPWIEVDFESDRLIGGIVTLGHRSDSTQFVKTYKIQYRTDGSDTYTEYTDAEGNEILVANTINNEPVFNGFDTNILARYVRLYPLEYNNLPTMRWEIFGCTANTEPIIKLGLKPITASSDMNCIHTVTDHIILHWDGLKTQANATNLMLSGKSLTYDMVTVGIEVGSMGCNVEYKKCEVEDSDEGCRVLCPLSVHQIGQPFKLMLMVDDQELLPSDKVSTYGEWSHQILQNVIVVRTETEELEGCCLSVKSWKCDPMWTPFYNDSTTGIMNGGYRESLSYSP
ncbi:hypothetical protein CAPTEDRAFT_197187 [Capitella teleta]|uniref:F5/8 type C domain-containing protein n=1 Tax=Capitella teleta TaxID=283909 RepID=R7UL27_CAPTE|nr:hypothetical protein CAPTEDRAFT_197187 [Capitella teleta]|eukprot:ELU03932.1 hypothetical protein CAPTEDRAFT_197187 [Capitella teleta]